jgi:hypothetical protein
LTFVAAANNEVLRKHFLQLTETFMVPLERYFASLMPLVKYVVYEIWLTSIREISVFRKPPKLKVFSEQEFLESIAASSTYYTMNINLNVALEKGEKTLNGKVEELYTYDHNTYKLYRNTAAMIIYCVG